MATIDAFSHCLGKAVASWLLLALYTCMGVSAGEVEQVESCDEVLVCFDGESQRLMAQRLADMACFAHRRFRKLFGINPGSVRVRMLGSMERWRKVTGREWYIVATIRDHEILTQPASSLEKLEYPGRPVVHELAHLFIRQVAGRGCPKWIDEGLAQWLAGDRKKLDRLPGMKKLMLLKKRQNSPDMDRTRRKMDYDLSLAMVQKLIEKLGKEVFISSLAQIARDKKPFFTVINGKKIWDLLNK